MWDMVCPPTAAKRAGLSVRGPDAPERALMSHFWLPDGPQDSRKWDMGPQKVGQGMYADSGRTRR